MKALAVLIGLGLIVGIYGCATNNRLVAADEHVKKVWADVEGQYQRRADLVPQLVNTVKGAANYEKTTLQAVVDARAKATSVTLDASKLSDPNAVKQFEEAQGALSASLGRLIATREAYPDLKANQNFSNLMSQLEGTENRINYTRTQYNEAVESFNSSVRSFPTSIVASMKHFEAKVPFKASTAGAEKAPEVKF
jgi:LemA protein